MATPSEYRTKVNGAARRLAATSGRIVTITTQEKVLLEKLLTANNMPTSGTGGSRYIRPSSATAKLQTHSSFTSTALYSDGYDVANDDQERKPLQRPKTHIGGPRVWGRNSKPATGTLHNQAIYSRRLTLTGVEPGETVIDAVNRRKLTQNQLNQAKTKIEEKISLDVLDELKRAFNFADFEGNGRLDFEQFKAVIRRELNLTPSKERQIEILFQKIDCLSRGSISWDEFCTYMQLEYAEIEDSYMRKKAVAFQLPATIVATPHREPVLRIIDTSDGSFMACSQDGLISFWSNNMKLKRAKSILTGKEVHGAKPNEVTQRIKPKWVTDFQIMPQYNKIILASGDREIQFYELSSFEAYCQISSLETVPLKLDYCYTGNDECVILYGDSLGCVNILLISSAGESLRTWKKGPKTEGIASISLDQVAHGSKTKFIRWKVHGDWVQQVKYCPELRQIISCSNHESTAMVFGCTVGSTLVEQQLKEIRDTQLDKNRQKQLTWMLPKTRLEQDQTVFNIYKGVKCFDFSKSKNIIATGGMDRLLRIWNPYVPGKPVGMLRGHNAPINFIFIADDDNRIFTISTDRCVKIWDLQDQSCLLTIRPKSHKIRGEIQACHYSLVSKTLAIASEHMNGLQLKLKSVHHADVPVTHKEPVHAVVYNPTYKQVITGSDGSVVKLWDLETGNEIFEFGQAHGDHPITCMIMDNTGRRLITGGRDGCIHVWNYNNGHCLKRMTTDDDAEEICAMTYVHLNNNRYVIAVGWDKRINIYVDSADDLHQVQNPLPNWMDDVNNGHTDDILSVSQCPPNFLATSSYNGEVIVWNMVSGHRFCCLKAPPPEGYEDNSLRDDMAVYRVVFLKTRTENKDIALLVSSGPRSHIHFWNVYHGGQIMSQFPASKIPQTLITSLETNTKNTILVSGDGNGFVNVWKIEHYCMTQQEHPLQTGPPLLASWRGHLENVTCISIVDEPEMVLTSSLDCTVRLWTTKGHYVGTFGQPDLWDIYNPSTYQHPMVPYDVLVDPMSLPVHPVIEERQSLEQVIFGEDEENDANEDEKGRYSSRPQTGYHSSAKQVQSVDSEAIVAMLNDPKFRCGTGKRLRHERLKPTKIDSGGPNEYQMLRCHNLDSTLQLDPPKHMKKSKDDPFDFFDDIAL